MDELFSTLFNQPFGSDSGTQVALAAISTLLTAVALMLLAHRNDLGWWVQILAVFAGPLVLALSFGYEGLVFAVPALAIAAYGLWRFSSFDLRGRFTRDVGRAPFALPQLVWGAVLALLLTAAQWGPFLFNGYAFQPSTGRIWLAYAATAVVTAALVGVANGVRFAWLAVVAGSAASVATLFSGTPAFGTLLALVLQLLVAGYGYFVWGALRPAGAANAASGARDQHDDGSAAAYPPSPYRD
ncbi:nicotinamide mononucleotide transporter [Zhihengliuella salsuginis]|uniref:Nicotinamide mononucleotide transporter n=1 Tax=Zhihengliuella salsuginis TaxID=578222 RepID=A0ABQ3GEP4_9MICC|nr:nicotinamide mononucleotide transporter [Zhihengliuella salsuginis]GHD03271.1 hypothetical protein GCM10008096_09350 [Zhihengliuella salsuginis]